jgi:hypothetical protein
MATLTCKNILDMLSEYIDEELDYSVCDEIENHMSDCTPCIAFLETLQKTVKLYNTAGKQVEIPDDVSSNLHDYLRANCCKDKE